MSTFFLGRFKFPFTAALFILILAGCQQTKRPNFLFAILDDATYAHMGAYGCEWVNTPNFDRIADQGILFMNAYTPNAKCAPSRSSILTGRNSWQLEEAANHWCFFPEKFKTFAEVLSENGYSTGYTGKGWAPGVPGEINGKPRLLIGPAYSSVKLNRPTTGISDIDYAANFAAFLDAKKETEPFFFWFGSLEPHRRYEYGSGIAKGNKKLSDIDEIYTFFPPNDSVITDLLDYAFEIEYFDRQLGKMLDEMDKRSELDNTMVVVTSDNGMPFPRIKGQEYELSNHMPLAIMWHDGIKNIGRTIYDFVSFIDFAPTFLELAGLNAETSGMEAIQGQSLTDILFSKQTGIVNPKRDYVLIGKERHDVGRPNDWGYPIRGIIKGDYLFIQNYETSRWPAGNPETGYLNCDGSPTKTLILNNPDRTYWKWSFGKRPEYELYDIKNDPMCMINLADQSGYKEVSANLKNRLYEELREQGDPRIFGNGHIFEAYNYADPSGVHFYERYQNGEELNAGWVNESDFEKKP